MHSLDTVKHGLTHAGKSIDSAQMYHNERAVGQAVKKFFDTHPDANREDYCITTKLASNVSYDATRQSIRKSARELGERQIDLFLIHSPYGGSKARLECWRAVEDAILEGEIKTGGVTNFGVRQVCMPNFHQQQRG